jgi:uncharacterized protein (TIGR03000 family)
MSLSSIPWLRAALVSLAVSAVLLPAPAAETSVPEGKALITVRLPAQAVLTIDGNATKQTGSERVFVTPLLVPNKTYAYTLKATWSDNGQAQSATEKVRFRAGQHLRVELKAEDGVEREPAPMPKEPASKKAAGKSRTFLFTYDATVTGLPAGKKARIWLPVPPSNDDQDVKMDSAKGLPEGYKLGKEKEYGNEMLFVEAAADKDGKIPLSVTYRVTRREVKGGTASDMTTAQQLARFLQADAMVPIEGKPLDLIKDKKLPMDETKAARVLYDVVNDHMRYDKPAGKPWGRGDSVWACDSGYGNCTDFHSLFITLARSQHIPAKFEMGFPLPEAHGSGDIPGYHCWAKFKPKGKGWIPVDISEANKNPKLKDYYFGNLTPDRVALSTGRDITLVPKQAGDPLNYFVYPYVEVDGKAYPVDKVQRKFSYKDVEK